MQPVATTTCSAAAAFATGILLISLANAASPPTTLLSSDPAMACANAGGTYLGDLKCRGPDGSVVAILGGNDAVVAQASSIPIASGTPHAWALATTAIIFQFNGQQHDLLGGEVAVPDARARGVTTLSQWWDVRDRSTLLTTLTWLQFSGHRHQFEELGRQVDSMTDEQFKNVETTVAARAALTGDKNGVIPLEIARKYHRSLAGKSILGWDLIRYIALCRWGYLAGYLSEREAWDHIMPAALRLQQTFGSWQDLQSNYLTGRVFWSVQQSEAGGDQFKSIYDLLLRDKTGPWKVNDWSMNLGTVSALPIVAPEQQ